jgi:choline dehydrogenase
MPAVSTEAEFVVVGAGSAGCVLARRLVDAGRSVVLLDQGAAPERPELRSVSGFAALWGSDAYIPYGTEPQRHAAGRRLDWPQSGILGGGSAVNGMVYARGHPADYDAWAYGGCAGWDWASLRAAFVRCEDHEDGPSEAHGAGGPLPVSRLPEPQPVTTAFVEAAVAHGLPFVDDHSASHEPGVGFTQLTARGDRRSSTWSGYVEPVLDRLTVVSAARVVGLVLEGGRCTGVRYRRAGEETVVRAGEVLLCAGTIGSAHLLLLSGVGPADELAAAGVPVRLDLPGVGANLHDHLGCNVVFAATRPLGPVRSQHLEAQVYWTSRAGLPAPDLQPLFVTQVYPVPGFPVPADGFTAVGGLVRPYSRGRLTLRSADPNLPPALDPAVFAEPVDLEALVDAVELVRAVAGEPALDGWRAAEVAPGAGVRSRSELRDYVRRAVTSYHHQVGTCRMGVDSAAVVDPTLRLHGVDGLRVADASVMPAVPSGNTNIPTVALAEHAAELILAAG